jgi:hypothetical protein
MLGPPDGAFWNEEACRMSHGLTAQSPQIQNGLPFVSVWTNFCSWIDCHVRTHEKCILCAYRGETCDMRWIWKHCLAPRSQLNIPPQIVYFMDPLEVIKVYKCPQQARQFGAWCGLSWMVLSPTESGKHHYYHVNVTNASFACIPLPQVLITSVKRVPSLTSYNTTVPAPRRLTALTSKLILAKVLHTANNVTERSGTKQEKMLNIPRPAMGCPSCYEHICRKCWDKGYDMHQKMK